MTGMKGFRWSKVYSFCCIRSNDISSDDGASTTGFSRVVYCNLLDKSLKYCSNYVSTTKYNIVTFFPKALFEQFRRVANLYFLFAAGLSLTPLTPFQPSSLIAPLGFVLGVSLIKEGLEDWRRHNQDKEVNRRMVKVHKGSGFFELRRWQNLGVGDVVMVKKDAFFPADLFLISSAYPDGICYVETMNLDGETNLKLKQSLEITVGMNEDENFEDFRGLVKCEDPNNSLYTFVGTFTMNEEVKALGPQQLLLRDSKLRNTAFVYGVVIFSGHETKVMQNATQVPSKRSRIERKMDYIVYFLFSVLVLISGIGSVAFGIWTNDDMPKWWYLAPNDPNVFYDPKKALLSGVLHLVTALILYGYLIPISLYVSIEIVKVLQAMFINRDCQMYHEETNKPAQARTSNLNEELGQVDTILSDKTGTLTCNVMDFLKCSIAGTPYGRGVTEVEKSIAKRLGKEQWNSGELNLSIDTTQKEISSSNDAAQVDAQQPDIEMVRPHVKGFSFNDDRLLNGNWVHEPNSHVIRLFFRLLAVCHSAIPEEDEDTHSIHYEAESPDEGAFVVAAREFGFEFFKRTQTSVLVMEPDGTVDKKVQREYKILNLLEFNSTRKRMSVVARDEDGQIYLFCKGADSVMFERLGSNGQESKDATNIHLSKYADAGLRTLILAYRTIDENEYAQWNSSFQNARNTVGAERDALLDAASDLIEKDLILIGATAVEDKLQKGVPECIDKLAQAGLKIWVLTGDKLETAINIGFACSLLRQDMKQIVITSEIINKATEESIAKEMIKEEINSTVEKMKTEHDPDAVFALIIDGKALSYALQEDVKPKLLEMAVGCSSVICCRVSPIQKALVTRLVRQGGGKTTLSVGDGANDVGMIQEADIGVGISGVEGMQAVMASDFAISQFRFLERLLIVHGHWCYKRIALMICYFFYKNVTFGLTIFYFEAYAGFSGQALYNDWTMSLFNVIFTSLPVMVFGVLEQDVSARACLQFPALYRQGPQNLLFNWQRILGWLLNSLYTSLVVFYLSYRIYAVSAFRSDGKMGGMAGMGSSMYTSVIWTVSVQMILCCSYLSWIQHVCIWGSLLVWYLFLLVYGYVSPVISTSGYMLLVEVMGPSFVYWMCTALTTCACLAPYVCLAAMQRELKPMDHHILQEVMRRVEREEGAHDGTDVGQKTMMWTKQQERSVHRTSVGFTAKFHSTLKLLSKHFTS